MASPFPWIMQVFFIVGAQKSGTTWLQKSLNSIDGIHCLGEGHFIDKLLMPMAQTRHEYNQMMQVVHQRVYEGKGFYGPIPDQEFLGLMRTWILNIMVRNAKAPQNTILALGDKTPANSFHNTFSFMPMSPGGSVWRMRTGGREHLRSIPDITGAAPVTIFPSSWSQSLPIHIYN